MTKAGILLLSCTLAGVAHAGTDAAAQNAQTKVFTTVERTVVPVAVSTDAPPVAPYDIPSFEKYGYGRWEYGPGVPYAKKLDLMPASYAPAANAAKLLHFFTMTDIHITDKESPAEAVFYGVMPMHPIISAYSPAMLYTTHVLDAAVRTANALNKENKFDFGLSLGDAANSTQYNELRWFIDVMDGKTINPSSGAHLGADKIDYQMPYKAEGLDKSIPWYSTIGNHDHFWMGSFPETEKTRKAATGSAIMEIGNIFTSNLGTATTGYYVGVVDGGTEYGTPKGYGPVSKFPAPPTVAADPDRRSLNISQWIGEFFNTTTEPRGHGFSAKNAKNGFANYTFQPNPKLPLEVIVLDDTQRDDNPSDGHNGPDWGHGYLDAKRYAWLLKQLDKGQKEGKLMIISAHVPIGVSSADALEGWSTLAAVTEKDLIAKLNTYPNLLMWVAGHRHKNTVTPLKSPDPAHPELGFWVVETASLREFPQQLRTFQIDRNADNTLSIFVADVDPMIDGLPLVAKARANAIAANQIFKTMPPASDPAGSSYGTINAELVKALTPQMQAKLKNCGTPLAK
jgi:metallophosphoesterase (TIGR03768 family)